ncbi:MAG: polysaccharide biosynthesis/export family protein [Devosia sp.]
MSGPRPVLTSQLVGPYTLDAGDVVRVTVYGEDGLSRSYRVDDSGKVAFPLTGPIDVRGKTTEQAAAAIAAGLARGFMRNPNVAVEIDTYRPFYIQGGIANPGQFAYVPGMTVRAAVSTAGGFAADTLHSQVTIYRNVGGETVTSRVGLDFPIFPGDTISVE